MNFVQLAAQCCTLAIVVAPLAAAGAEKASFQTWFTAKDQGWVHELSPSRYPVKFTFDVRIPMRDGVRLSANIWRPDAEGKFPVILIFTPYGNDADETLSRVAYFVSRGFVVASVNSRGRFDSDGESYLFWRATWAKGNYDGIDVDDCLTWLGQQPWSTGKIGMVGVSYVAFVQWLAAPLQNPYLATIVPYASPDDLYENVFPGGALRLSAYLNVFANVSGRHTKINLKNKFWNWDDLYLKLPLRSLDQKLLGERRQNWQDLIDHPDHDDYWRFSTGQRPSVAAEVIPGKYADVRVPTLNVTGWYDTCLQGVINNYLGVVRYGPADLRGKHQLIIGPWVHSPAGVSTVGDLKYGQDAQVDFLRVEHRWFDRWLKGLPNGVENEAQVHRFLMGENRWIREKNWPLAQAVPTRYYLHSTGNAVGLMGGGTLHATPPADEPADTFVSDPDDPVPSIGGNVVRFPRDIFEGPRDQRPIQMRSDVLVYTSNALEKDMEVTGPLAVKLYASSSAKDTDFTAKLVDLHPNGYAQILEEGLIRARYRESFKTQKLITPDTIYEYMWSGPHF